MLHFERRRATSRHQGAWNLGVGPINLTWTTSRSRSQVREWVSGSVVDALLKSGYRVTSDTAEELVMTRRGPSSWPMLFFSTIAFWLSDQRMYQVVFKFLTTTDGKTQVLVIGDLPDRVASIMKELTNS